MRHRFSAPANQRPKMLIVDDQPLNIRILYELFRIDFDVFMAGSGGEAVEKCASLLPDLVLLDVVMPGMDGFQVLEKALRIDRDLIPIMITGKIRMPR